MFVVQLLQLQKVGYLTWYHKLIPGEKRWFGQHSGKKSEHGAYEAVSASITRVSRPLPLLRLLRAFASSSNRKLQCGNMPLERDSFQVLCRTGLLIRFPSGARKFCLLRRDESTQA